LWLYLIDCATGHCDKITVSLNYSVKGSLEAKAAPSGAGYENDQKPCFFVHFFLFLDFIDKLNRPRQSPGAVFSGFRRNLGMARRLRLFVELLQLLPAVAFIIGGVLLPEGIGRILPAVRQVVVFLKIST